MSTTAPQPASPRLGRQLACPSRTRFRQWWEEFEAQQTGEARFAKAVDRLAPILLNYYNQGASWQELDVTLDQALRVNRAPILTGAPEIWAYVETLLEDAAARGFLRNA